MPPESIALESVCVTSLNVGKVPTAQFACDSLHVFYYIYGRQQTAISFMLAFVYLDGRVICRGFRLSILGLPL